MKKTAESNTELAKIVQKYSISEVERAQSLLREKVRAELLNMSKEDVKQQCKMSKFDDFYRYLLSFMEEL